MLEAICTAEEVTLPVMLFRELRVVCSAEQKPE
jgi:hypothetical protein